MDKKYAITMQAQGKHTPIAGKRKQKSNSNQ